MIRKLRSRHRWLLPLVALVTGLLATLALLARKPMPIQPGPPIAWVPAAGGIGCLDTTRSGGDRARAAWADGVSTVDPYRAADSASVVPTGCSGSDLAEGIQLLPSTAISMQRSGEVRG